MITNPRVSTIVAFARQQCNTSYLRSMLDRENNTDQIYWDHAVSVSAVLMLTTSLQRRHISFSPEDELDYVLWHIEMHNPGLIAWMRSNLVWNNFYDRVIEVGVNTGNINSWPNTFVVGSLVALSSGISWVPITVAFDESLLEMERLVNSSSGFLPRCPLCSAVKLGSRSACLICGLDHSVNAVGSQPTRAAQERAAHEQRINPFRSNNSSRRRGVEQPTPAAAPQVAYGGISVSDWSAVSTRQVGEHYLDALDEEDEL